MNQGRWQACWRAAGLSGDPTPAWYWLAAAYAEPQRHYHTGQHIAEGLQLLAESGSPPLLVPTVELAWWFHDAIYDPRAHDNEERSAAEARRWLTAGDAPDTLAETVSQLILATKHHDPAGDAGAALVVDLDLSIFGQSPVRFQEYELQIRREYAWVPEAVFRARRREVLERFLGRARLYHSPWFATRFTAQARANLVAARTALAGIS